MQTVILVVYSSLATPEHGEAFTDDKWLYMAGNEVFKVAVTQLSNLVKDTLAANNMDKSELDWLVPHQANLRIISATAKKIIHVDGNRWLLPLTVTVIPLQRQCQQRWMKRYEMAVFNVARRCC